LHNQDTAFIYNYIFINDSRSKFLYLYRLMLRVITIIFVIGILVRLVSRYILPIFQMTSMARERMKQMQEQMNAMQPKATESQNKPKVKEGDYIDYEEIPLTSKGG
jgi:uncharacterized membrane protein (DUF106 family)